MLGHSARLSESFNPVQIEQFALYRVSVGSILECGYSKKLGIKESIYYSEKMPNGNGIQRINRSSLVKQLYRIYPKSADRIRKTLIRIGPSDWNRMETAFHAVGASVLTCPDLNKNYWTSDYNLLMSVIRFKTWFVMSYLRHSNIKDTGKISVKGYKIYLVDLPNQERTLRSLKLISNWAAWYMAGLISNSKPDIYREIPGFHGDRHLIPWFGGHLGHLRDPWVNIINPTMRLSHCLSQIRTFGRALPPPTIKMAIAGGKETMSILTTPKTTPAVVLEHFRAVAERFGRSLPKVGLTSHVSISKSASNTSNIVEGGRASDINTLIQEFLDIDPKDVIKHLKDINDVFYDAFGSIIFIKYDSTTLRAGPMGVPLPESLMCTPNICLFAYPLLDSEARFYLSTKEKFGTDPHLNGRLGHILLMASTKESMSCGSFKPPPDILIANKYPVWRKRPKVLYKSKGHIWLKFKVLCEPGLKIRPLTMQPAWYTTIMQSYRHMIEAVMTTDVRLRLSFEEEHKLWSLLKYMGNHVRDYDGWEHTSADYKAATDHLAFDLIKSMWSGFFNGNGIPFGHPLRVFFHLIWEPKLLVYPKLAKPNKLYNNKPSDWYYDTNGKSYILDTSYIQWCGSNMGEPLSFLTLSLYNICVVELSAAHYVMQKSIWELPVTYIATKPTSITGMVSSIVGDDLYMAAPYGVRDIQQQVVAGSGMFSSKGKDFTSRNMMVLCEDHSYYLKQGLHITYGDNHITVYAYNPADSITYLDVIKIRLLTRMNRVHSDNRASILGKGTMLSVQLDWNPIPLVRHMCRSIYLTMFNRTLNTSLWAYQYPVELPPVAGGMSLPIRDWEETKKKFSIYLRYLQWMLSLDITNFVSEFVEIININRRLERGVYVPVNKKSYLDLLKGLKGPTIFNGDTDGIFTRQSIIDYLQRTLEIPKSPYSDQYIDSIVQDRAQIELGLVTLRRLLRSVDRILAFTELLNNPSTEPIKYSIFRYQKNLAKFWKRVKKRVKEIDLPDTHSFKSPLDISLKLNLKLNLYVPLDRDDEIFSRGPSLKVDWRKRRICDDKPFITSQGLKSSYPDKTDAFARKLLGGIVTSTPQSSGPVRVTDARALSLYEQRFKEAVATSSSVTPYEELLPSNEDYKDRQGDLRDPIARLQLGFENVLRQPRVGFVQVLDDSSSSETDSD